MLSRACVCGDCRPVSEPKRTELDRFHQHKQERQYEITHTAPADSGKQYLFLAGPEIPGVRKSWQGALEKQGFSACSGLEPKFTDGRVCLGAVVHLAQVRRAQEAERWREVGYELLMR